MSWPPISTCRARAGVAFIYGDAGQTSAGSANGALSFALSDTGSTAALSFTGAGGTLSVNGAAFTLLRTEADLALMNATPGGNFAIANDITLATPYTNSVVPDFYGHLEGLGHTLQNLSVTEAAGANNIGFFGILDSGANNPAAPAASLGEVSNLFLANANVGGGAATGVGALVGENFGHVYNSGSSGTVAGSGSEMGGLVGANFNYVEQGFSSANVVGAPATSNSVGGLVGLNNGGVIGGLSSGVTVQGDDFVGGLVGQSSGYVNAGSAAFAIGNNAVGGVVGQNNASSGDFTFNNLALGPNGTVTGAFGFGGVFGTNTAGGVVGVNTGVVSFSYYNGPVSGDTSIGGLVGENDGTINNSYALGPVSGTTNVGGLVGLNNGAIDSTFAMGATRGTTDVGGLVGLEGNGPDPTSVTNSYSTGAVSGPAVGATGLGGLIGAVGGLDDTITNAYWDTATSGQIASAGGAGYITTDLQGGAALPLDPTTFAGGAAGGETGVYPYLTGLFGNGVRAISGFAYKNAAGTIPLVSNDAGAATVFGDFAAPDGTNSIKNPATTGANGYYYIFADPTEFASGGTAIFPTGATALVYTSANPATGATNAATYALSAGANNSTGVNIFGLTLTETTGLPTYSQLAAAVTAATAGDTVAASALAAVSFINITSTGPNFLIDQAISTPADLTVTGATTLDADVTATGGVNFNSPITLAATTTVDSGAATTFFASTIDGSAAPGVGLSVTGPVQLNGNVTTSNGALAFDGAVTINANVAIDSGAAATTFGSTIDSTGDTFSSDYNLIVAGGSLSFGGPIGSIFSMGAVSLTSAASMTLPSITSTSTFARTTAAGASLTLAPGTVLTASGVGTAVTLAAAGAFINNAGAGAIALTGGPVYNPPNYTFPNWLVYSANPAGDTFGGLNSNNQAIFNTPFPAAAPPTGGDYYLFAFQPTVTFTSINDAKTYGQDVTARVATDFTVTGLQPAVAGAYLADTAARAYSGAPSVTSAGLPTAATVTGSPYAIDVAQGTLAGLNGYALAFVSTGQLSVAPEAITITASPNTKTYDSTPTAAGTPTVTTGALFDAATLTETYATSNAGNGLTLNPQIAFGAAAAANNYIVTLAPAQTGIINPEPITITATANTKAFDGNTSAASLPVLTAGALFDPATLSETYATFNPASGIVLNPAIAFTNPAAANNYAITLLPTGTTPPDTGIILPPAFNLINFSPSVYVNPRPTLDIPGANATCGVEPQLPNAATFSDPVAAVQAISAATEQYVERCRDASQEDIANALDRYADALQVIIEKLPPKLRAQLRHIPAIVHMAAARARVAPTRVAAVRVLRQVVAQVRREIMLVRAEDPDSARIRDAVSTGVSGVLNASAVSLARAEGI